MSDVKSINQVKKSKEIKIGFIADDISNFTEFDLFHNATFALMLAAQKLGAKVLLTESNNLKIINNKVFAKFNEIILKQELPKYLEIKNSIEISLDSLNIIFARKDPPINENFIAYIQTLCLLESSNTFVVNNPAGILKANEKLYPLNFPQAIPPTIVTSKKSEILDFLSKHNEVVIKPLFNKGGEGVFYLNQKNNNDSIISNSTLNESKVALVQQYLREVRDGDKRIVLLNGDPLGAIYRVPKAGEFRANVRRGATVKACELSKRDIEICEALKPALIRDKIYFASIDLIGNYLIEVNVTCPASLQEVERCTRIPVAEKIVSWAIEMGI